jgi:beta-lactam-binding protein with PASTA domain
VADAAPSGGLPDLRGRSVRTALRLLRRQRLEAVVVGSGRVAAQRPAPGTRLEPAGRVTLLLERRPLGAGIAETPGGASRRGLDRSGS